MTLTELSSLERRMGKSDAGPYKESANNLVEKGTSVSEKVNRVVMDISLFNNVQRGSA